MSPIPKKKETEILKPKERTPSFRTSLLSVHLTYEYFVHNYWDLWWVSASFRNKAYLLVFINFANWESIIWINLSYVWFYWWWTHTYLYIDYFDIHQLILIEYQIETNDSMNQRNSFSFFWVKRVGNEVRIRILEQKDLHADCMTIAQVTIRYIKS